MATLKKGFSNKRKQPYWEARWVDPVTKAEKSKRFWFSKKPDAQHAFNAHLEQTNLARLGLGVEQGLEMSYPDLVAKFIKEADLSTTTRRNRLKKELELPLRISNLRPSFALAKSMAILLGETRAIF